MKAAATVLLCGLLAAGCSDGVSDAQVEAAIQKCIADGQANFSNEVRISNPDPAKRAEQERQAKQAIGQVAEIQKREVESMCRQSMPIQCEKNPDSCR